MGTRIDLLRGWLDSAFEGLAGHFNELTLAEALFVPPGGYRSIFGTIKHAAGWSHVYRSYAFDPAPVGWRDLAWPRGLRDTIVPNETYLREVIDWLRLSHRLWQAELLRTFEKELDELRPVHWRAQLPLAEIVRIVAGHHIYHAGEINQLLSICRHEAWEEGEEVEENLAPSPGHRVRPPWRRAAG